MWKLVSADHRLSEKPVIIIFTARRLLLDISVNTPAMVAL
jgi:hypothetical protein